MRGLLVLPDGDAEVVEGDWDASFEIGTLIEAEYVRAELIARSCATCPVLAIWINGDPEGDLPVNQAASRVAEIVVFGKALIVGLIDGGDHWEYANLDTDELLRLAARVVLAKHNLQLKQGEADE